MSRTLSLAALSTMLLATAVEAYSGKAPSDDGYRAVTDRVTASTVRSLAASKNAAMHGDNCGVEGYPWLSQDGQPLES